MRMRTAIVVLGLLTGLAAPLCLHAGEARSALMLSVTILPSCIVTDDATRETVRARCNFPRPYRIDWRQSRTIGPAELPPPVTCPRDAATTAPGHVPPACGVPTVLRVKVIYF
ncbi:MAG TPA: hypothetical protein VFY97_12355 [Rhodanobacteraceae bacterium]|nr:hypothetical protein [Rhodanobacteraceae bacterium]